MREKLSWLQSPRKSLQVAKDEALEAEDEDVLDNATQVKAAEEALSSKKSEKQGILSQALVERWCNDAKEKNSMAAFDRLMKVGRILSILDVKLFKWQIS